MEGSSAHNLKHMKSKKYSDSQLSYATVETIHECVPLERRMKPSSSRNEDTCRNKRTLLPSKSDDQTSYHEGRCRKSPERHWMGETIREKRRRADKGNREESIDRDQYSDSKRPSDWRDESITRWRKRNHGLRIYEEKDIEDERAKRYDGTSLVSSPSQPLQYESTLRVPHDDRKRQRLEKRTHSTKERRKRRHHRHESKHRRHPSLSSSLSTSSFISDDSKNHHSRTRKERKKDKKTKKNKKKNGSEDHTSGRAVTHQWGKYGTIQECDKWSKKQEFQLWLMECKKMSVEGLPPWEEKSLFLEYMEDYNTATLPHQKYYNLEKWEKSQFKQPTQLPTSGSMFDDERERLREIKAIRERQKAHDLHAAYQDIKADVEKVDAMKQQKLLENQMRALFRMGRLEEAQQIRNRLKPEDR